MPLCALIVSSLWQLTRSPEKQATTSGRPSELQMLDLLLPQGPGALPPSLTECADTLAQVAAALQLSDTSPAALAAAALQAASDAQRVQDQEVGLALGGGPAGGGVCVGVCVR